MAINLGADDSLLIVDVQRDFLPGGALGVPAGDRVLPVLNRYVDLAARRGVKVYASRDWHCENHHSFRRYGGPWPVHCVAGSEGAQIAEALRLPSDTIIIDKGRSADKPGYSAFEDTGLEQRLCDAGVRRLLVGGLATDYCVLHTVRDALKSGFQVLLLTDAIQAVNVNAGDGERAVAEMTRLGAQPVGFGDLA